MNGSRNHSTVVHPVKLRKTLSALHARILCRYGVMQVCRRGFWYVDVPRTGSTSIRVELGQEFGPAYHKARVVEAEFAGRQYFRDHIPAREMRDLIGVAQWNRLFTFAFVRNPWDRVVSFYHYRQKVREIPANMTFRDYVMRLAGGERGKGTLFPHYTHHFSSCDFILGEDGKPLVSLVGRYENREADLKEIGRQIGLERLGTLHLQRASPPGTPYSEYYDTETRGLVARLYEQDVEIFRYRFE